MYPLVFDVVFKEKIWGGKKLYKMFNLNEENSLLGEAWTISAHKNGITHVLNGYLKGKSLDDVLNEYRERLVGKNIYNKFHNKFPLLIKYLDINDKLSIQVHPDDNYAIKKHNEFGKSECWYVLDASDDAKLILGMNTSLSKNEIINRMKKEEFNDIFNIVSIKKGDFIAISPGTVHATLQGSILLAEIQQNSDITYRIYDFDRLENGKKRELHIEDAINTIDFSKIVNIISTNDNMRLVKNEYFTVDKVKVNDFLERVNKDSFEIITVLSGNLELVSENQNTDLSCFSNVLIPVNCKYSLFGNAEILISYMEV